MKKIISLILAVISLALLLTPALAADPRDDLFDFMYVNCANGKTLNLRDAPNGKVIGHLDNGEKVYIYGGFDVMGWVHVETEKKRNGKYLTGYVKPEFLQNKKPGKYEITEREDNFVQVARPYYVTARALNAKTDNSVGLRVKPNKTSKAYRRLLAGDQLLVLASGKIWLQVQDMETGYIGYVANDYMNFDYYMDEEDPAVGIEG